MTTACLDPQSLFDALIAGLDVPSQNLGAKCEAALEGLGGRAIPPLRAAIAEAPPRSRGRIHRLLSMIGLYQDVSCDFDHLVREALVTAASVQTDRVDTSLIAAIQSLGPAFVDILVKEAVIHLRRPAVCLRVLQVIEQLGDLSQSQAQMEVIILNVSKSLAVRELAARLLCRMRPQP